MYQDYFGFTQVPFSIAPDPQFLYLGPRHQEAMTHLRQGLTSSGGFLLLTGEVGTGKTTISRAIMHELKGQLDIAFVLNPKLSEWELLATICDEFGLTGITEKSTLKNLTDLLRRYIQESSESGRHPVVLIDEAQHLLPSVLEQLRLLTNLETDSRKLLSVVLIGQPELQTLLQQRELRQVAQRIVARYHLMPLTAKETSAYIYHRLQVAGGKPDLFTAKAIKAVFSGSEGTPRLINLICDRSLQLAAAESSTQVFPHHVAQAVKSLSLLNLKPQQRGNKRPWMTVIASLVLLSFGGYATYQFLQEPDAEVLQVTGKELRPALGSLAGLWRLDDLALSNQPCEQLAQYQLGCLIEQFSARELAELGLPAVLQLRSGGEERFIIAWGYEQGAWQVTDATTHHELSTSELTELWSGRAVVFWQRPAAEIRQSPANTRRWIQAGLQQRVPFSLQREPVVSQLQWLQQRLNSDRARELDNRQQAWLSSVAFDTGPRLSRASRPRIQESDVTIDKGEYVLSFPEASIQLANIAVPEFYLSWAEMDVAGLRFQPGLGQALERVEPEIELPVSGMSNSNQRRDNNQQQDAGDEPSDYLQMLFDAAVREAGGLGDVLPNTQSPASSGTSESARDDATQSVSELSGLHQLPENIRQQLPVASYDAHMYSRQDRDRWIRLDGVTLREGEQHHGLRIVAIEPGYTIFAMSDRLFSVEALEDIRPTSR